MAIGARHERPPLHGSPRGGGLGERVGLVTPPGTYRFTYTPEGVVSVNEWLLVVPARGHSLTETPEGVVSVKQWPRWGAADAALAAAFAALNPQGPTSTTGCTG